MEFFFLVVMIIGILIALSSPSAFISYIIAFLAGIFAGRIIYERKGKTSFPYIIIIAGFAIGYLLGIYYGDRRITIVLFVAGAVLSYKLHDKKIFRDVKY